MKRIIYLLLLSCLNIFASPSKNKKPPYKALYFKDSVVAKEFWYHKKGTLDSLKTYYKNGKLNESFYYDSKNRPHGICYQLDKKSVVKTTWEFEHGDLIERIDNFQDFTPKNEEYVVNSYLTIADINLKIKNTTYTFSDFYKRAHARYKLGNNVLALHDFTLILNRIKKLKKEGKNFPDKTLANVYDVLASLYSATEQEKHVIHYKFLAIKTEPENNRLKYNLGSYLVINNATRLGIHYLDEVIKEKPSHSFANWLLGIAYTDLEMYEDALIHLNIAFKNEESLYKSGLGTAEKDLQTMRGYVHHKLGDTDKGIIDLQEALNTNAENTYALRCLGEIYYDLEDYEKACDFLNKSKKLGYESIHDKNDLQYFIDGSCFDQQDDFISTKDLPYISPNPVKNIAELVNYSESNFSYLISDYQSNIVQRGTANGVLIDVNSLPSGFYILLIEEDGNPQSIKFIKD